MTSDNEERKDIENLKYEVAQEMGLPQRRKGKTKKSKLPG
ncbi:hypothetical protein Sgly_2323 [Syntrophobotulus glycolicus DSM 8271]|uniref:Uncharacterized protein n=1 Tax=Syntrophobotulus glycolicus (strain DSM 8271 / FlGlyR) TaxID=645991 RepID=F0SUG1_SYNGF|nr:small, acid-soluble spore protein, alpha/beta type [Syntrophobotulus glycolicus]ADY56611.1 hypothetical protein Sgly_2323 [Syntrophobotulus glycolicus DSM 8271]